MEPKLPQADRFAGPRMRVDFFDFFLDLSDSDTPVDFGGHPATRLPAAAVDATGSDGAGTMQPVPRSGHAHNRSGSRASALEHQLLQTQQPPLARCRRRRRCLRYSRCLCRLFCRGVFPSAAAAGTPGACGAARAAAAAAAAAAAGTAGAAPQAATAKADAAAECTRWPRLRAAACARTQSRLLALMHGGIACPVIPRPAGRRRGCLEDIMIVCI